MLAENLAERRLQQMGRGVIAGRCGPVLDCHLQVRGIADLDAACLDPCPVDDQIGKGLQRGDDLQMGIAGGDFAGVTCLSAAFAVEGRGFGYQIHFSSRFGCFDRTAVLQQGGDH